MKDPRSDPKCPHCHGCGVIIEDMDFFGQPWSFMVDCHCNKGANLELEWAEYISETLKEIERINMR